ncbi:MAG: hypothetical protein J6B24_00855 [Clostridia bacterium]|nr:hypothetical protein [Clostridia bacterium]
MNTRIDIHEQIAVEDGNTFMEDVTVYATTRQEALAVSTESFVKGSMLFIINEGRAFMLNEDGSEGEWRDISNGSILTEGGDS